MKRMYSSLLVAATVVAILFVPSPATAQAPSLGTAGNFGVLAGSAVENTGTTTINGEVGVAPTPGDTITGFPPGTATGGLHENDAVAQTAQDDLTVAYNGLAGLPCPGGNNLTGIDLGTLAPLPPGVYCFSSSAQLTGTLTLDAGGDPAAEFIFQIGSTLTTASSSVVQVINGGSNCNVYWQVGSSATLGTTTTFAGNILALAAITATTGVNVSGRLLARTAKVSLDTNNVTACSACISTITLSPTSLPNGTVGGAYSQTITATGGTSPYSFAIVSGSLPPGLTLSPTPPDSATISGTPTTAGSFTFTLRATDAALCSGTQVYTIVINAAGCPVITLTAPPLPSAVAGTPYGPVVITSSGGPATFTVTSGALPPGLSLSAGGVITGTPTLSGSFTFTVTASDPDPPGCFGSQIYTILVNCPVITVPSAPPTPPNGATGVPYGPVVFTGSGGTPPYTFAIVGQLPPGLTLSAGGTLSGTPFTPGIFQFTITATGSANCSGGRLVTITITGAAILPSGGPTLDSVGLTILILLLAAAGVLVVNRFST